MNSRDRVCGFVLALGLLVHGTARANDGEIRIEMDPNTCGGFIACGESRQLKIYVSLSGATLDGITGLELGMQIGDDGSPDPGWNFMEDFTSGATVTIGHGLFGPPDEHAITPRRYRGRGINMAWGACQSGERHQVLIETARVTNSGCSTDVLRLIGTDHDSPANSYFQCPLATLCDAPVYTKVCLGDNVTSCPNPDAPHGDPSLCSTSGYFVLNPPDGMNIHAPCSPTAVQPSSWGGVKGLYR
jgi:hypothetical protein